MKLKILLPFEVFAEKNGVRRIIAETSSGFFGILPHRLDCVAALTPGILIYEEETKGESFVAVDEGILVKTGDEVLISVRRAHAGKNLSALKEEVEKQFFSLDETSRSVRSSLAKMESGFMQRLAEFQNG